jgi:hypothetical protein
MKNEPKSFWIQVASEVAACSTIILGKFGHTIDEPSVEPFGNIQEISDHDQFKKALKKSFRNFSRERPWTDYGFVLASLNVENQPETIKNLKKLGFTKTRSTYNKKNKTKICLMFIPVSKLVETLGE